MNIKKIFLFLSLILIVFTFTGCKSKQEELKEINISYAKGPLNIPSILIKNLNLAQEEFKDDKIKVNFHDVTSGPQQVQALMAGDLDILHAFGGTSAIISASNGADFIITNIYSRSPKGFILVTKSDKINSPKDLKGKKVGGPKGTVLHQLLAAALEKEDMNINDVEFINMKVNDCAAALEKGVIDAALLTGPAAENSLKHGAKLITSGEGLIQGVIVTAVSSDFYKKHPDIVKRFINLNKRTTDFIESNFDKTSEIVSAETGLSKDDIKKLKEIYDFSPEITEKDITELKNTQEFLLKNGLQENRIDIEKIILK